MKARTKSRPKFFRRLVIFLSFSLFALLLAACGGGDDDVIRVVWNPSDAVPYFEPARNEIGRLIEEATGRPVEHVLTTSNVLAIEAIANGTVDIAAVMGPIGYLDAQDINPALSVLVVNSGPSGTLDDAVYYSWIAAPFSDAHLHASGDTYSVANIQGMDIAFTTQTSASGFFIPATYILDRFSHYPEFADLDHDDIIFGNTDLFGSVSFLGSHPAAAFGLLSGQVDVAAFNDMIRIEFFELTYGEAHAIGSVYTIGAGAEAPFDTVIGEQFMLIGAIPILNGPFVYNPARLSASEVAAIRDVFTTDEVANNEIIFVPPGDATGLFRRDGNERFVVADDSWYDPLRAVTGR